jgi:uncharacterized membrane protein
MLYLSYYTYWRAMSLARSTVVVMLIQLAPVLTLILSAIFLQEYLTYPQLIGFVLIIISATAFSIEREQKWAGFAYGGVIFTMLVSDLFFAISAIIAKHTIEHTNVFTATAFEGFGVCTGGALACLTFKPIRDSFVENLRTVYCGPVLRHPSELMLPA